MLEEFIRATLWPVLAGLPASFALELLLEPRPAQFWKRPWPSLLIHIGIWLLIFVPEYLGFRRPWFAAANVLALQLSIILIGNAKYHSLREVFLFQDFSYFTDALRHPRLYIPFLGWWRALAALVGIIGVIILGMSLETPITASVTGSVFLMGVAGIAILAALALLLAHWFRPPMSYQPESDLQRHGLLNCLWCYAFADFGPPQAKDIRSPFAFNASDNRRAGEIAPDLIAIQSESFFDARKLFAGIRPELLKEFDALKTDALAHGALSVAAWGANTVRTEFAFLSGLAPELLGPHRFNPYRRLAKQGIATIASYLRQSGYRTICLHPYSGRFYEREIVMPLLGFDEFIAIEGFTDAQRFGPYIADQAVTEKILQILNPPEGRDGQDGQGGRQPVFIFAITMENHGPLHLEQVAAGDIERLYCQAPPVGCEDLTIYLRHLANADAMLRALRQALSDQARPAALCFYGDHVPIMSGVYQQLGTPDGMTDYVIWQNWPRKLPTDNRRLAIEYLAGRFLSQARQCQ